MTDAAPRCSDLTVPDQSSTTVRDLLSRYLARQYRDFAKLRLERAGAEAEARVLSTLQRHCRELASGRAGPLFSALQRCTVGGMIRFLSNGAIETDRAPEWVRQLAAGLYGELALAEAAPPPLILSPPPGRLILLGTGTSLRFPADTLTARLHPDGVTYVGTRGASTVTWEDVRASRTPISERACEPLATNGASAHGPVLALADDSPLAAYETHPDKEGNRLDLGGVPAERWVESLRRALELVRTGVPEIAAEIELLIQQLVPVGFSAERHLSASYQEMIGTIYLSLHPDPLTLAEALIHEHSHNKINMLWTLAPVLHNAFSPEYSSPFRPDPRPLHGVLLAVHAFLPVERLYERLAGAGHEVMHDPSFERRRQMIRERNSEACATLALHAQPTATGKPVLDEIMRWNAHFS